MKQDRDLSTKLHDSVDRSGLDVESQLAFLHEVAGRRTGRRRASAFAVVGVIVALAVAAAWSARGTSGTGVTPAGQVGPQGTIAYLSGTIESLSVRTHGFGGSDGELLASWSTDPMVVYSPDGTKFALAQRAGDGTAITIFDADGTNPREVGLDLLAEQVTWSPDGGRLAFTSPSGTGTTTVSILDLATDRHSVVHGSEGYWRSIAWSPDGSTIALAGGDDGTNTMAAGSSGLWTIAAEGGEPTQLVPDALVEAIDWAPDGSRLVFGIEEDTKDSIDLGDIATVNADGSGFTMLVDRDGWDNLPVWSPDGEWIAFSSDRDASPEQQAHNDSQDPQGFGGVTVYLMRPDGTNVRRLLPVDDSEVRAAVDWKT